MVSILTTATYFESQKRPMASQGMPGPIMSKLLGQSKTVHMLLYANHTARETSASTGYPETDNMISNNDNIYRIDRSRNIFRKSANAFSITIHQTFQFTIKMLALHFFFFLIYASS